MAAYRIDLIQDQTYVDRRSGGVVEGFAVTYTIHALDQQHTINVPKNDPKVIDELVRAEIVKFEALSKLGA